MARSSFRIEGINELLTSIRHQSENVINKELMDEIGAFLTSAILKRTAKGKDVEGGSFEPYSSKYKLFRMKKGLPHDKVDLFFTGSMLSSLTHTAFKDKVKIFFLKTYGKTPSGKPSKVSNPEKAYFLNRNREFFGVGESEAEKIREMINEHLRRLLNGEI